MSLTAETCFTIAATKRLRAQPVAIAELASPPFHRSHHVHHVNHTVTPVVVHSAVASQRAGAHAAHPEPGSCVRLSPTVDNTCP
jgi:hypothetical protein